MRLCSISSLLLLSLCYARAHTCTCVQSSRQVGNNSLRPMPFQFKSLKHLIFWQPCRHVLSHGTDFRCVCVCECVLLVCRNAKTFNLFPFQLKHQPLPLDTHPAACLCICAYVGEKLEGLGGCLCSQRWKCTKLCRNAKLSHHISH